MTQLSFADLPTTETIYEGIAPHIVESFLKFHQENPQVYRLFKDYAHQLKNQGRYHYGAKAIMERIRWHFEIDNNSDDFKLNNNYTSCFVRLLLSQEPTFSNFFETRSRQDLKAA